MVFIPSFLPWAHRMRMRQPRLHASPIVSIAAIVRTKKERGAVGSSPLRQFHVEAHGRIGVCNQGALTSVTMTFANGCQMLRSRTPHLRESCASTARVQQGHLDFAYPALAVPRIDLEAIPSCLEESVW